jgi:hypothetical protein
MKIYLAGGMGLIVIRGRERKVCKMFSTWKRVFSFYYLEHIYQSEILKIVEDENK